MTDQNCELREIRHAEERDVPLICVLGMHVWVHTYADEGVSKAISDYVLNEFGLEHWTKRISDPNTSVLVAVSAGNLVGFSVLRHLSVHGDIQVEIETLYVLPSHWRLGVGSELLQASRDCARERTGCMSVWLAVNAKNTRALQFYRDRGSSAVGKTDFVLDGERHENIVLTFRAE